MNRMLPGLICGTLVLLKSPSRNRRYVLKLDGESVRAQLESFSQPAKVRPYSGRSGPAVIFAQQAEDLERLEQLEIRKLTTDNGRCKMDPIHHSLHASVQNSTCQIIGAAQKGPAMEEQTATLCKKGQHVACEGCGCVVTPTLHEQGVNAIQVSLELPAQGGLVEVFIVHEPSQKYGLRAGISELPEGNALFGGHCGEELVRVFAFLLLLPNVRHLLGRCKKGFEKQDVTGERFAQGIEACLAKAQTLDVPRRGRIHALLLSFGKEVEEPWVQSGRVICIQEKV